MPRHTRFMTDLDFDAARNAKKIWIKKKSELGLNQTKLANLMGVSQGSVASWFNGHLPIGTDSLLALAKILKVDPREIRPEFQYAVTSASFPSDVTRIAQKLCALPQGVRSDLERTIDTILESNYVQFVNNAQTYTKNHKKSPEKSRK